MLGIKRYLLAGIGILLLVLPLSSAAKAIQKPNAPELLQSILRAVADEDAYQARLADWKAADAQETLMQRIHADQYAAISDHEGLFAAGSEAHSVLWQAGEGWIEWEIEVQQAGLYHIGLVYRALDEGANDILRGIQLDGSFPFAEAGNLILKRQFAHARYPFLKDSQGNDRRPPSVQQTDRWMDELLSDYAVSSEPLRFHLAEGTHRIRLVGIREAMEISELYVTGPSPSRHQAEMAAQDRGELREGGQWIQIIEAENIYRKSNPSIGLQSIDAVFMSPQTNGLNIYNAIGGEMFRKAGEWVEWEFEVPQDGVYWIGFKYLQAYLNNSYSYRTITIDGQPLFDEMKEVAFPYSTTWQWEGMNISDSLGNALPIPLAAGKHVLRMTANSAPIMPVYQGVLSTLDQIGGIEQQIRRVTGNFGLEGANLDMNRDWQLDKYIPDLTGRLEEIASQLSTLAAYMSTVTIGVSDTENAFLAGADDLRRLSSQPRKIASRLDVFRSVQNNLSNWAFRLLDQPLMLDYFWVAEPGAELPQVSPRWWQSAGGFLKGFYQTFTIDYEYRRDEPGALNIWVNRARDYANLIQQLADETFTLETGIPVNVNIVPDPQLFVLGNIADVYPDVALGVDQAMPIDFAMRGALADLGQFSDYSQVADQFLPGALRVFYYDGKEYALPEVQGFQVLMYRTDIFDSLGIEPPQTWRDLEKLLPTLQQNGYDMYIPPKDFQMFVYQNGGELYSPDGMASAMNSEQALQGFEQWLEMFTLYQLPKEVPSFYSHFRLGTIPIGIVDFNTYLQVQYAAPELANKWRMLPVPGIEDEHGKISRWSGGAMQAGVIYDKSEKKEDAWAFLKWWVSAETQERFGHELEASFGPEYRWNTANQQALAGLSWPKGHLATIQEQLAWYREMPQLPGGYFTARQLDFAWNKVITENAVPREALEQAYTEINREMVRKQIEFGLRDSQGNILRRLNVQPIEYRNWGDR